MEILSCSEDVQRWLTENPISCALPNISVRCGRSGGLPLEGQINNYNTVPQKHLGGTRYYRAIVHLE
jgi:hypothetical protein